MGMDGLPIDSVENLPDDPDGEFDVSSLLVEYSAALGQIMQSAETFEAGELQEMSIRSERLQTIFRPVTEEYFLILALGPGASAGKGRYVLRVYAPELVSELT
jgi:predicted regulator of Ras-like GTPase activity (Roadblock/LC7/MglB family)